MKSKLEQIFWKEGKYVNNKNNEVDPKQIGKDHAIRLNFPFEEEEIQEKAEHIISKNGYSSEINSYIIGTGATKFYSYITEPCKLDVSLGFYKI